MGTFLWTKSLDFGQRSVALSQAVVSVMVWQDPMGPALVLSLCLPVCYCTEAILTMGTHSLREGAQGFAELDSYSTWSVSK